MNDKIVSLLKDIPINDPEEFAKEIVLVIQDIHKETSKKVERMSVVLSIDDGQVTVLSTSKNNAYAVWDLTVGIDSVIHGNRTGLLRESDDNNREI